MGFRYATGRLFKPKAVEAGDWWLSGGISAANCIAAYQPKGAASYAASKVNLANPGTYNADDEGSHAPTWSIDTGWTGSKVRQLYLTTGISITDDQSHSYVCRYSGYINNDYSQTSIASVVSTTQTWGMNFYYKWIMKLTGSVIGYINTAGIQNAGVVAQSGLDYYNNGIYKGSRDEGEVDGILAIGKSWRQTYYIYFYHNILAFAAYNTLLTSDQVSALTTAMNAL